MLSFEKSSYADFDAVYDDMLQQLPKEASLTIASPSARLRRPKDYEYRRRAK